MSRKASAIVSTIQPHPKLKKRSLSRLFSVILAALDEGTAVLIPDEPQIKKYDRIR